MTAPATGAGPARGPTVPFVEPGKLYGMLKQELDSAYFECMERGDLIDREHLRSFEDNLARFVGTEYAVGLNSGYDALHLALQGLGVGPGDEVIVPAHTFVATASAVVNVGAKPVLVDIRHDFNVDIQKLKDAVTPRTKALLPVHLNGYMADMAATMEFARSRDLLVVEDACQSLGATCDGRAAGSWGNAGCWSFYPFKILGGYGDGGALTTNDAELAAWARRMRYNGEDRQTRDYHGHGRTCLLDNLQAAWLDVKLRYLPAWIERRNVIAQRYTRAFSDLPRLRLPSYDDKRFTHVYQNYVVLSQDGDAFVEHLRAHDVGTIVQFRKPYYKHEALKLDDTGFPVTEEISAEVCSLPMNVEMSDAQVDHVIATVRSFYGK